MKNHRTQVRSMHPSHRPLKGSLDTQPFRAVVRLGSTTSTQDCYPRANQEQLDRVFEINTVSAIKNSANKLLMKQCFTRVGVKTAQWWVYKTHDPIGNTFVSGIDSTPIQNNNELSYPIVSKSLHGSRGEGNAKHDTQEQLEAWMRGKDLSNYIFEKFYTYSKEYRIHVTADGCFYTCRKLLKNTAPEGTWQRHDDGNVVWILEENEAFKKPSTWNLIVADCVKALASLGLTIGSFDVMTQGSSKENPEWIIVESQSAPSFGDVTLIKYKQELNNILNERARGYVSTFGERKAIIRTKVAKKQSFKRALARR